MADQKNKKIATRRIEQLFEEAEKASLHDDKRSADRYVELARNIGMRYNVPIPSKFRRRFCKRCYSYLLPSKTCRTRVHDKQLISVCKNCGHVNRFGYDEIKGDDKDGTG